MTIFKPILGSYEPDVVVGGMTILLSSSGGTYPNVGLPTDKLNVSSSVPGITWSSSIPIGMTGMSASSGQPGVQPIATGRFKNNMRDSFTQFLSVNLSLATSGSGIVGGAAGLSIAERYDLRSAMSGSDGGAGTIVFEIGSGSITPVLVNPTTPVAVGVTFTARTTKVNGSQP